MSHIPELHCSQFRIQDPDLSAIKVPKSRFDHVSQIFSRKISNWGFVSFRPQRATSRVVEIRKGHVRGTVGYVALLQFSQTRLARTDSFDGRSMAHGWAICTSSTIFVRELWYSTKLEQRNFTSQEASILFSSNVQLLCHSSPSIDPRRGGEEIFFGIIAEQSRPSVIKIHLLTGLVPDQRYRNNGGLDNSNY